MLGEIYVERWVNGQLVWLKLECQASYKEWSGCFTRLY